MFRSWLWISIIPLIIFLTLPWSQSKIVGLETHNACSGLAGMGLRRVSYSTLTVSSFEGLAHYKTWCLFWMDLGRVRNSIYQSEHFESYPQLSSNSTMTNDSKIVEELEYGKRYFYYLH